MAGKYRFLVKKGWGWFRGGADVGGGWRAFRKPFGGDAANRIRANAGIQAGEIVGVRGTPGLTGDPLTDKDGDAIFSSATAASFSDSGTGTEQDPYLVLDKRFDNSEVLARCINMSGTDAYFIEFRNCWFSGYDIESFRIGSTNNTVICRNCLFTYDDLTGDPSDSNTVHIQTNGGNATINIIECLASSGGRTFIRSAGAYSGIINITDTQQDDSDRAWTGTNAFVEVSSTVLHNINAQNCTIDGTPNTSLNYGFRLDTAVTLQIFNCDFNRQGEASNGAAIGSIAASSQAISGVIRNCHFRNQEDQCILLVTCDGITIGFCTFESNGLGAKQLYLNGVSNLIITNTEVHNCKFTKFGISSNENYYALQAKNAVIRDSWVTQSADDGYEIVRPQAGNVVRNCVGDNCTGQVVDVFDRHPTTPGDDTIVENIYGSSDDIGVLITGNISVDVTHVEVETLLTAVVLEQRDVLDPVGPFNCAIVGPIVNSLNGLFGTIVGTGVIGPGNTIENVEGFPDGPIP